MITLLRILCLVIVTVMIGLTTTASLDRSLWSAAGELWPDLWFRATLADAYFAFLTVFAWIAYKEQTAQGRVLWFVLVMSLGTIAIAVYLLWQMHQLRPGDPIDQLLLRTRPVGHP